MSHKGSHLTRDDLESIEIRLLLEAVYQHYGYDFRKYARGSLRRRLWRRVDAEGCKTISGLQERVLHNPVAMDALLMDLSVNVTAMFRDPTFYMALRSRVIPILRTYPFIRVWIAGCSTGEEVYSMAIMLREEGLLDRARIYATDINERVLERAGDGVLPLNRMQTFTQNYLRAGGTTAFSEYYKADGDRARVDNSLLDNVVFAHHNLVSDGSFNEFHLIVCRNVMIYFDKELQDEVHDLLHDSLVNLGILALGNKESIHFSRIASRYEELDPEEKIYRRIA
ncbi:MAG TPA: protein-glutamate O-methyltransferase CheR [Actinomycetota bacterium]|nr:protein-glutamate O-methyltransferase CheR [Actinomycetota bacterium]